jgi:hypothetical protein
MRGIISERKPPPIWPFLDTEKGDIGPENTYFGDINT